jgi:putative flavoprotein involved in K+ transport
MNASILDVIVVGAGHTGLSISYHLKDHHLSHLVLEKSRIGDTWHNQRWDSFKLNTPNKWNLLPGQENMSSDPDGFCSAPDFAAFLEGYSVKFQLPVIENCEVLSVECVPGSNKFSVHASENGNAKNYRCKQIVIASGGQNIKSIPSFFRNISPEIIQLYTSEYRNASALPDGAILVIGSAQSGVQIAEDLIVGDRKVFISTSQVPRVPRRYRGKDIVDWLVLTGFYDLQATEVTDPRIFKMKQPQISTVGQQGHTLSLQALSRNGAVILGRTEHTDGVYIYLQPNATTNIRFADEFSEKIKRMIDDYIQKSQLYAPPPDDDPDDDPDEAASFAASTTSLNLKENNITSIIWATGVAGDFSYLKLPVFNGNGMLSHNNGISETEGLYFLGLPWLRKRKSGIILGIEDDAMFITRQILEHSGKHKQYQ